MSTSAARLIWRNAQGLKKDLDAIDKQRVKAAEIAARSEGNRLREKLKGEVYKARPGGTRLKPLTQLARRTKKGKFKKFARKPLARTGRLVRYNVEKQGKKVNLSVGFLSGQMKKRSWKRLLLQHQAGGKALRSEIKEARKAEGNSRTRLGRHFARIGAILEKRGDPDAKFFFLTTHARRRLGSFAQQLPPRPLVDPFLRANENEVQQNMVDKWERKMAGEYI